MSCNMVQGNALHIPLADGSVQCVITSPPYWSLRDYGTVGQLGLESTPTAYVANMVSVFREVWRVLRDDGTLWLNLGDSYASGEIGRHDKIDGTHQVRGGEKHNGSARQHGKVSTGLKPKDLVGIPWRVAFALQADGWYLRSAITWCKKAPMPESVSDRPTSATEMVFLLAKQPRYFYDAIAVREPSTGQNGAAANFKRTTKDHLIPGQSAMQHRDDRDATDDSGYRNLRNFWLLGPEPYPGSHFATFPTALVEPCILAGTSAAGVCAECGAPWERVTEPTPDYAALLDRNKGKNHVATREEERVISTRGQIRTKTGNVSASYATTGWRPTCAHAAPTVPATVLDPFSGSGTVGKVCIQHRRNYVGIDLNPDYIELAMGRTDKVQIQMGLGT